MCRDSEIPPTGEVNALTQHDGVIALSDLVLGFLIELRNYCSIVLGVFLLVPFNPTYVLIRPT